mmetsp:Transcript_29273/g.59885  ORF Transcript_29273/g.59885 Transcript_29273/m.59885 type:complete len:102 (+) Transcript_29273:810-1115(+)
MKYRDAVNLPKLLLLLMPRKKPATKAVFSAMLWLFRVPSSRSRASPESRAEIDAVAAALTSVLDSKGDEEPRRAKGVRGMKAVDESEKAKRLSTAVLLIIY